MCGHMPLEAAVGGEGGVTDATLVGLDPCVGADVRLEHSTGHKGLVTLHTLVWLLT